MPTRIIETEHDRKMLVRFIEAHKLPMSVNIVKGRKRSDEQNRLQRLWVQEIAEQLGDCTAEEIRGYAKLHFGVPILRNENEEFARDYDEMIRPLPYEYKLKMMQVPIDIGVTRIMTTKQKTDYLDAIWRHFSEQGIVLTDPGELLHGARKAA